MFIISHRGNIEGKDRDRDNNPSAINEVLSLGYDVEVDVWYVDGTLVLGHDYPEHEVTIEFLSRRRVWCHSKTLVTLEYLLSKEIHTFYHESDAGTLTNRGFIWTYPGEVITSKSIAVMPELADKTWDITGAIGVCTDFPIQYTNLR